LRCVSYRQSDAQVLQARFRRVSCRQSDARVLQVRLRCVSYRQSDGGRRRSSRSECAVDMVAPIVPLPSTQRSAFWRPVLVSTLLERAEDDRWPRSVPRWTRGSSTQTPTTWTPSGTSWTDSTARRSATDMPPKWCITLAADLCSYRYSLVMNGYTICYSTTLKRRHSRYQKFWSGQAARSTV